MKQNNLSIGILGCGIVGKSVIRFLSTLFFQKHRRECSEQYKSFVHALLCKKRESRISRQPAGNSKLNLYLWDQRELTDQEYCFLRENNVFHRDIPPKSGVSDLEAFFQNHDIIIPSPGIDISAYSHFDHKIIRELDLFAAFCTTSVIAITGTVGKTSVTTLVGSLLSLKKRVAIAGNIGEPMLDTLTQQDTIDYIILEVSSFQLEGTRIFAPDIAVWTNFYPNHLDRHKEEAPYFQAKSFIMNSQTKGQVTILGYDLFSTKFGDQLIKLLRAIPSKKYIVSTTLPLTYKKYTTTISDVTWGFCKDDRFFLFDYKSKHSPSQKTEAVLQHVSRYATQVTFEKNLYLVFATLHVALGDLSCYASFDETIWSAIQKNKEHRLELCATFNGTDFYNDSKATVPQATLEAVQKLAKKNRPIVLILGGLDKGVDRTPLLEFLHAMPMIKKVFCFGAALTTSGEYYSSLEAVVDRAVSYAQPGDQVLFSPSGASFDLFKNYKERGNKFKQLVKEREKRRKSETTTNVTQ